jgi:hypothetical protein
MTAIAEKPVVTSDDRPSVLFTSIIGVTSLIVLVQGVLAGVFLEHDGQRDASSSWIDAHAWGAHISTVLAIGAALLAIVKLRQVKPLLVGSIALAVLLLLESYLGGLIRDSSKDVLTIVHVPLALSIMGVTVWLSLTAARIRRERV